jgi:hypothetical protein
VLLGLTLRRRRLMDFGGEKLRSKIVLPLLITFWNLGFLVVLSCVMSMMSLNLISGLDYNYAMIN